MSQVIPLIFNIASISFFVAEIFSLLRKWKARKKMDSTSLEGTLLHMLGNFTSSFASFAVGAYIAVCTEIFLGFIGIVKLYLKIKWWFKWKN